MHIEVNRQSQLLSLSNYFAALYLQTDISIRQISARKKEMFFFLLFNDFTTRKFVKKESDKNKIVGKRDALEEVSLTLWTNS